MDGNSETITLVFRSEDVFNCTTVWLENVIVATKDVDGVYLEAFWFADMGRRVGLDSQLYCP